MVEILTSAQKRPHVTNVKTASRHIGPMKQGQLHVGSYIQEHKSLFTCSLMYIFSSSGSGTPKRLVCRQICRDAVQKKLCGLLCSGWRVQTDNQTLLRLGRWQHNRACVRIWGMRRL